MTDETTFDSSALSVDEAKANRLFENKLDELASKLADEFGPTRHGMREVARELWAFFEDAQNRLHEEILNETLVKLRDFQDSNPDVVLEPDDEDA